MGGVGVIVMGGKNLKKEEFTISRFYYFTIFYYSLRNNYPYSELFCSVFSRIQTKYREILRISPYSVQIREKAKQNSEYGHFSLSD